MKNQFSFVLLILIFTGFRAAAKSNVVMISPSDTLIVVSIKSGTIMDSAQQQPICLSEDLNNRVDSSAPNSDIVSALTFAVNSANNVLTGETIVVGILTLLVAYVGLFEYHRIIRKVNETQNEARILKEKNKEIEKFQSLYKQYMQCINTWILENADAIAEANGADSKYGHYLKNKSSINHNLMKLYLSTDETEIGKCISYIKTKGGKEEITYLQFIVDNDLNKYKRDKASEAIGYIRGRLMSEN